MLIKRLHLKDMKKFEESVKAVEVNGISFNVVMPNLLKKEKSIELEI